jgi:gas vesicle protein
MNRMGATLLGMILGAGAALLLAPRSGPETRRRLRDQADTLRTDAQGRLEEGRMRVTELIRSTQDRAHEVIDRSQQVLPEALSRGRRVVDETAETAQQAVSEGTYREEHAPERLPEEGL